MRRDRAEERIGTGGEHAVEPVVAGRRNALLLPGRPRGHRTTGPQALRTVLSDLIADVPALSRRLAERVTALDVAYAPSDPAAHPLTGRRAPDLRFAGHNLFTLLHPGRHVLLDLTGKTPAGPGLPVVHSGAPLAEPHPDWTGVLAALIRPDGHVGWASDEPDDQSRIAAAEAAVAATHR
ncbi:aromatic-ring hydroxylase C-terminal domain-containing protein [Sinosporangium siamense]|uniref:Uncharacterized protein n=1 Tax=Sinosporangium siamense TaxID=1367973 RepID=A0A919RQ64_9ACTN|nr:hypothetical protein [Sinosporangium siamense]GII96401.1 hypothetical protein Ssi02_66320 [Sinosporangium siamense]